VCPLNLLPAGLDDYHPSSFSFFIQSIPETMRSNKETVLAYVDAFNRGDVDALCALFAADAKIYGVLGWGGLDRVRPVWEALMRSFAMRLEVDAIIAEDDVVAVRYTESGASFQPCCQDATGATYEVIAMEWFEVRNGVIQRRWCARDAASVFWELRVA
jgi:hypothetical protein